MNVRRRAPLAVAIIATALIGTAVVHVKPTRGATPSAAAAGGGKTTTAASTGGGRVIDGRLDDWPGTSSGLAGTSQYSDGEFVYQDYLFDDLGPETRQRSQQHGSVEAATGDYRYPTDDARYGNNAADLQELRFAADGDNLYVLARLSTLKAPDTTVVAIAVDLDRTAATGGGSWPYAAGLSVPGADAVITLWGTGGSVTSLPDGEQVPLPQVAADIDNDANAIEARVPLSLLHDPSTLRVWAATGLWDAANSTWMAAATGNPTATTPGGGAPTVAARAFNVAFRDQETGVFLENEQATALASGDITRFHADVDLYSLRTGANVPYEVRGGRFYAAIIDEGFSIPPYNEGLAYDGVPGRFTGAGGVALSQEFDYFGRYQPYGVYVPSTFDGATPLPTALVLHGLGGSYSSYNTRPGFIRDMGEGNGTSDEPPLLLVTPLARGESFYADWGEADTLAVLHDAAARFSIDPSRLYLTGYSMGGYGVYRLGSLYPDLFASAAAWAGYTGEFTGDYLTNPRTLLGDPTGLYDTLAGALAPVTTATGLGGGRLGKAVIGDPVDTLENFRHLPLVHLTGTNDEIVPNVGQYAAPRRLAELGYRSRWDLYPGYDHFAFALVDDWKQVRSWLGNRRRDISPRDVDFTFSDGWTAPGLSDTLGLVHDGAWWLRGLTMRESTEDGRVLASAHARSWALPADDITPVVTRTATTAPTPNLQTLVSWLAGPPLPITNRLDLDLANVNDAAVSLDGAGLHSCGLEVHVHSDGPARVVLVGAPPAGAHLVTSSAATLTPAAEGLALDVGAGDVVAHIACA